MNRIKDSVEKYNNVNNVSEKFLPYNKVSIKLARSILEIFGLSYLHIPHSVRSASKTAVQISSSTGLVIAL